MHNLRGETAAKKMSIGSLNSAHQAKRSVKLKDLFGI